MTSRGGSFGAWLGRKRSAASSRLRVSPRTEGHLIIWGIPSFLVLVFLALWLHDPKPPVHAGVTDYEAAVLTAAQAQFATCHAEAFPTTGTIRYVCDCDTNSDASCVVGNDSNSGATHALPFRTYAKAIATINAAPAGGTVAFCRGGAWDDTGVDTRVNNGNTTAASPLIIRDYTSTAWTQSSGNHDPRINGAASLDAMHWLGFGHDEGYRVLNIDFEATTGSAGSITIALDVTDVYVCGCTMKNGGVGFGISGSGVTAPCTHNFTFGSVDNCAQQKRITVTGNDMENNVAMGFLGTADDLIFSYNVLLNNNIGGGGADHQFYLDAAEPDTGANPQPQYIVPRELIEWNYIANTTNNCDGTQMVSHGAHQDTTVRHNVIKSAAGNVTGNCWGLAFDGATTNYSSVYIRLVVDSNIFDNWGNVGLNVDQCQDCTIQNNLFVSGDTAAALSSAIWIGKEAISTYDLANNGVKVLNNTVYFANNVGSFNAIRYTMDDGQGAGAKMSGNVVYYNVTNANTFGCFQYDVGAGSVQGGTISSTVSTYTGTTNGGLDITINGSLCQVTGLNLSAAAKMQDVSASLTTKLAACTTGVLASWTGTSLEINTTALSSGVPTTITVASAPTGSGSPTNVITLLGLSSAAGATTPSAWAARDNNLCFAPSGPTVTWDSKTGKTLSQWVTASGVDGSSLFSTPNFVAVGTNTTSFDFRPATGSILLGAASHAQAPTLDFAGLTRDNPPDIGAFEVVAGGGGGSVTLGKASLRFGAGF